jgi:hypothetical protein
MFRGRSPTLSKLASSLVVSVVLLVASHTRADDNPHRVEAKRLRDLGAQAVDRGSFDEALTAFQRAAEIYSSPNLRFDIGVALDGLGRTDEAVAAFEAFLDAPSTADDARDYAVARIRELEPKIARLALTVTPPQATVRIDGRPMRLTPGRDLPLMPGTRTVTVGLEDFVSEWRQVKLSAGRRTALTIGLTPARPPAERPGDKLPGERAQATPAPSEHRPDVAATPAIASERRSVTRRAWFWVAMGSALASVGTAVALGVVFGRPHAPAPSLGRVEGP